MRTPLLVFGVFNALCVVWAALETVQVIRRKRNSQIGAPRALGPIVDKRVEREFNRVANEISSPLTPKEVL